ncbi:HDAC6 [Mytilus coruscus]|uniref:HDAC6 n=1 Tax=Mytilus coruscus TaxID=42192 RepID=A0A6J8CRV0_MYTCO|nr:HDAC6 [Mytilus coruscus]
MADSGESNNQQGASGSEGRPNTRVEVIQYLEGQGVTEMYAVNPLTWCPHLETVAPLPADTTVLDTKAPCEKCGNTSENWICLGCYRVLQDKKNSAQEIKLSIDQFYDYFKSFNKNEDADTDNQDFDEAIENIDNEDIIIILDRGIIPDSWLIGVIKPLFKNKRDINNLDNYRTICHTSNLGKVFTAILNARPLYYQARLNELSDKIWIITDAQGGFRQGYSVQDNSQASEKCCTSSQVWRRIAVTTLNM